LGTIEFNSSCFYRYANIDLEQLKRNLLAKDPKDASPEEHESAENMTRETVGAFLVAAVTAIPTGKQNSMAAQNQPSFVFALVRDRGLWSLANAFVQPVRPSRDKSLVQNSVEALDSYWGRLTGAYGAKAIVAKAAVYLDDAKEATGKDASDLQALKDSKVTTLDELIAAVGGAIGFRQEKKA
jgi:CRISPR system Cascade subunit CasC